MISGRFAGRVIKLVSIVGAGMVFQAGGCAATELVPTFVNTFSSVLITNAVNNFLGLGTGFF